MRDQDAFLEKALLAEGRVSRESLHAARAHALEHEVDLADALVAIEAMSSRDIALVKAELCEVPFLDLPDYDVCHANARLVSQATAERYCLFPLFLVDRVLTLAMDDPLNLEAMDQVRQLTRCEVDAVLCDRQRLRAVISRAYSFGQAGVTPEEAEDEKMLASAFEASGPVVQAVNQLIADAIEMRASDIHINPDEDELRLRYRVDGVLQERQPMSPTMHAGIVQRLKIMAGLDLTQTRRPQDGKFRFTHESLAVEIRMSTMPTVCGENAVLRLLSSTHGIRDFHELGVPVAMVDDLETIIAQPHGTLLVTGPTGSGKTTTLYTVLNQINHPSRNIMTIEDPVEIRLPYVRQIQAHPEIGLTFAAALRSILRQDPDVVLVGEIRDEETARIALQAALTGHLVLSTLHTNDAAGAVARLRNYGLPPFVINSAVLGVLGQRLVRRVCAHCAKPDEVDPRWLARFDLTRKDKDGFMRGEGCGRCGHTGYRGRMGLYELLKLGPKIQAAIERGDWTERIRALAVSGGMRLMWQDGLEKARMGKTTLEEVAKVALVLELEQGVDPPDAPDAPGPPNIPHEKAA